MSTIRPLHRRTRLVAFTAALGMLATLTACSPATTDIPYAASDGIRLTVADVSVVNLLVLASEDGSNGRVLGAFNNSGTGTAQVTISVPSGTSNPTEAALQPGQTVNFNQDKALLVTGLDAKPGSTVTTTITVGDVEKEVQVPVLGRQTPDGDLNGVDTYNDLVPENS